MIHDEYEIKFMLSKEQYEKLSEIFLDSKRRTFTQTNYYYDTHEQKLRKNNITARIREKSGKFTGEFKNHSAGTTHSRETRFRVDGVSSVIWYKEDPIYLHGKLYTKRTEINICDEVTLTLDHNKYLDAEDYELELEYEMPCKESAIAIILSLQSVLGRIELLEPSKPKSERFFRRLSNQNILKHEGMVKNELGK